MPARLRPVSLFRQTVLTLCQRLSPRARAYLPVDPFPVDVAADTAIDGGTRLRHCPPLLRSRPDVDPTTVTLPLPPT